MHAFANVAYFLITMLFSLFTFSLWMRIFIRYFAISPFFAFSQSIYQMTNPVVTPIQRILNFNKKVNVRYDVAGMILLTGCVVLKYILLNALFFESALSFVSLVSYVCADVVIEPCNILFYAIIARVIVGWLNPGRQHPLLGVVYAFTEPMLRFFRQKAPVIGMIDLSALFAIITLQVVMIFVRNLIALPIY